MIRQFSAKISPSLGGTDHFKKSSQLAKQSYKIASMRAPLLNTLLHLSVQGWCRIELATKKTCVFLKLIRQPKHSSEFSILLGNEASRTLHLPITVTSSQQSTELTDRAKSQAYDKLAVRPQLEQVRVH